MKKNFCSFLPPPTKSSTANVGLDHEKCLSTFVRLGYFFSRSKCFVYLWNDKSQKQIKNSWYIKHFGIGVLMKLNSKNYIIRKETKQELCSCRNDRWCYQSAVSVRRNWNLHKFMSSFIFCKVTFSLLKMDLQSVF